MGIDKKYRIGIILVGAWFIVGGILAPLTAIFSIPIGVGVLLKKNWGRLSAVVFESIQGALGVVIIIAGVVFLFLDEGQALGIQLIIMGIAGLLLANGIIYFLNRAMVKQIFLNDGNTIIDIVGTKQKVALPDWLIKAKSDIKEWTDRAVKIALNKDILIRVILILGILFLVIAILKVLGFMESDSVIRII